MALRARWNWQRCHVAPPRTALRAARKPAWSSETTYSTPRRPRATRLSRNARQWTSASDRATETPSTRRRSSGPMPIAESTATSRTTPPWRIFSYRASRIRYLISPRGRLRQASSSSSSSLAARLTCEEDRLSMPNSRITASTSRVDTPLMYISATASITARTERRPRSSDCG
jgi:hypothetical protein